MSGDDSSPLFEHDHADRPVFLPGNMLESAAGLRHCTCSRLEHAAGETP